MLKYVQDHWRGNLSLAKSFWINFVGIRLLLFLGQANWLQDPEKDYSGWNIYLWALIILGHGVLFIWQVVGVFRSSETYLKDTGSQATVWGAQLSTAIGLFLTISYALAAWQATIPPQFEENFLVRMDREHASKYELKVLGDGETLTLSGTIELGITRNLAEILRKNANLKTLILQSDGGNIFEARGVAKLLQERGLATHVSGQCSSACTMAYAGGAKRSMSASAKFGFHQYRVEGNYAVLNADPKAEQERDKALFKSQGVASAFLEKIFSRSSNEMWFPQSDELIAAGFVHTISDMTQ